MEVPSMVRRTRGKLAAQRQLASSNGEQRVKRDPNHETQQQTQLIDSDGDSRGTDNVPLPHGEVKRLPQCKVKRNYACGSCGYFTQNPRSYLSHLRDTHGEKIIVNECKKCVYASRHHQKLVRHMRMVHGAAVSVESSSKATTRNTREVQQVIEKEEDSYKQDTPSKVLDALVGGAYTQPLVASLLPPLLRNIEQSWPSSIFANIAPVKVSVKSEMDGKQNVAASPERDSSQKAARKSSEESETVPKKRSRPIPNLIPLAASAKPEKELLKPVPMSVLMPPEVPVGHPNPSDLSPSPMSLASPQTKCTFCELSFESTMDLANHIAASHKEDLITSLLQKSIDESNQNLFPQTGDTDSVSNEMWKSLLEANLFGAEPMPTRCDSEQEGKGQSNPSTSFPSKGDDDEVEILENKSETYCGVETAPGYGEVTSKLSIAPDPSVTGLMKKVFKCPHCSFWASTASRFHVHIVGHLNKKPFECSLCSYRSNWRWDITKHIRLKTIRDPSHKNAGVLMNDETGRRNYTKYNKYITLMHITDNTSGNGNNATSSSSNCTKESAKSFPESSMSDLVAACSAFNIDLKALATMPGFSLLLDDKPDDATVGNTGNTNLDINDPFKCQFCEFRTPTKEELLLHMANTHIGIPPPFQQLEDVMEQESYGKSSNNNNSTANNNITPPASTPTPPGGSSSLCSLSKSAANTSNDMPSTTTNGTPLLPLLLTPSGAGDKTNHPPEQGGDRAGEGEGSSHTRLVGGMPSSTWRHSAPYRCGHCHQVSNWKHRHCRLKHNGHVFIEHVNAEKEDPADGDGQQLQRNNKQNQQQHSVYVIEDVLHPPAADHTRSKSIDTLVTTSIPPPLAPFSMDGEVGCPANTLEPIVEILDKDPTELINFNGSLMPSTVLVDSGTVAPAVPSEQLECISCQFRAETVEQLTEHLEQHMSSSQAGSSNFDTTGLLDPGPTTMYYCPRCPARFLQPSHMQEHKTKHETTVGKSCSFCSYTTVDDDERSRHEEVHSAAYNINTDNLQIFLAESKEYPKPQLTLKESAGKQLFYVELSVVGQTDSPDGTPTRKGKKSKHARVPDSPTATTGSEQLGSIFLCEYCDQTFDAERELNAHVRTHFASILSPQEVAYYTSLSNTLDKEKKLELLVSGAQSAMAMRYVYDNARRKDWNVYSKTESVLLKF
uniref:C2H2-type domain-containing protein n=1 Tax=Anopheles christyi TaxID=43041 RepID=A0A182K3V9_9DIPT